MSRLASLLAAVGLVVAAAPAFADRAPTTEERGAIESALREAGFTEWGDIELDDGRRWQVDAALGSDGRRYDLELEESTLEIVAREPD